MFRFLKEEYSKFMLGGAAIFGIKYLLTIILTEFTEMKSYLSYGIAMIVTIILLFDYNAVVTFHVGKEPKKKMILKFLGIYAIFHFINWYIVYILVQKVSYLVAIPITTFLLANILYIVYKKFVFKKSEPYIKKYKSLKQKKKI